MLGNFPGGSASQIRPAGEACYGKPHPTSAGNEMRRRIHLRGRNQEGHSVLRRPSNKIEEIERETS